MVGVATMLGALSIGAVACGDDDDSGSGTSTGGGASTSAPAEKKEVTVLIPGPGVTTWFPLYVGEGKGYFEEEGIDVKVQPVDGSAAVVQQVLAGNGDFGLTVTGSVLSAVGEGAELNSVYVAQPYGAFKLMVPEGSDISELSQLKGKTIGIGSKDGGEYPWLKAMLKDGGGLEEGVDYKTVNVGDGAGGAVAFEKGDIDAFSQSFFDVAVAQLKGAKMTEITPEEYKNSMDAILATKSSMVSDDPDTIEGFGRAFAKATAYGIDNPDYVIQLAKEQSPEEVEDEEFARKILDEIFDLYKLPPSSDGKWGYADPAAVEQLEGFLVTAGTLKEPVGASDVFTNDFVDAYNDFSPADL